MKKIFKFSMLNVVLILIMLSLFVLVGCSEKKQLTYKQVVDVFKDVTVTNIYSMQKSGESFYLYTGRESCEYCVAFAGELRKAVDEMEITVYYLDSVAPYEESSLELKDFRDKYSIETVPSLILFKGDSILDRMEADGDTTKENIIEFFNEMQ